MDSAENAEKKEMEEESLDQDNPAQEQESVTVKVDSKDKDADRTEDNGKEKEESQEKTEPEKKELSPQEEIEKLKETVEHLKDARLRIVAEFNNYKKRTAREQINLIAHANEDLIKELIPVLENFERALHPDHKKGKGMDYKAIYKGVEMIYNQYYEILKKTGLEEDNPVDQEFDAKKHEAMMYIESKEVPENKIAKVIQKGYLLNEKVIQYAKVAVSKGNTEKH
jgi:molecular chaperone GrpE